MLLFLLIRILLREYQALIYLRYFIQTEHKQTF